VGTDLAGLTGEQLDSLAYWIRIAVLSKKRMDETRAEELAEAIRQLGR
jgi:hypothetical protein